MKKGDKIKFTKEFDVYPHSIVEEGETGIIESDGIYLWITLDKVHEGLSYWDNKVQIGNDERKSQDYLSKI